MSDQKLPLEPPPSYDFAAVGRQKSPSSAAPPTPRAPLLLDLPLISSLRTRRVILASASPRRKQLLAQVGLNNLEIFPSPVPEHPPPASAPSQSAKSLFSGSSTTLKESAGDAEQPLLQQQGHATKGSTGEGFLDAAISADLSALSPFEYVLHLATRKALAVYSAALNDPVRGDPALVLAADTVVVSFSGSILEKPRSEADHLAMLRTLSTPTAAFGAGLASNAAPSLLKDSMLSGGSGMAPNATAGRGKGQCEHKVYTAVVVMAPLASARDPGYALENHVEETTVRFGSDISEDTLRAYVKTREGADKAGGYAIQGVGGLLLVDGIDGSFDNVVGLPIRATLGLVEKVLGRADDEGRFANGDGEASDDDDDDGDDGEEVDEA